MLSKSPIDLKKSVNRLDSLPAIPAIAQKLLLLKMDNDRDEQRMLLLIAQDPLISAKIIGLANSPLLGVYRRIDTVREAALLLGLNRVHSVSTGLAIMSKMNKSVGRLDVNSLWEHNIGIAFTMLVIVHAMPPQMRPNDDLTYLAGMLHDIGYLVLAHIDVARSDELQTRMVTESERLSLAIEHDVVELTHDELGAELANHWNLSEEIVAAIRFHHEPSKSDSDQSLARIINLTEKLLPSFIFHERVDVTITPEDWLALGIDPDSAQEISERIAEQAEQASQFISSFN